MKSTDDLVRIASMGGGIDMRHHNKPTEDLVRIAAMVGSQGGQLFISGSRPTDDLVQIVSMGGGRVVVCFEP
jgi:hypothetical protein